MARVAVHETRWAEIRQRTGPLLLTTILAVATGVVFVLADLFAVDRDHSVWLALLLLPVFVVAEATQLHVEYRRQNNSISLSEIPLVLGLFVLAPAALLVVRVLAVLLVSLWQRRSARKSAFNLALMAAEVAVAAAVFTGFGTDDVTDARCWRRWPRSACSPCCRWPPCRWCCGPPTAGRTRRRWPCTACCPPPSPP